jgi:hypothetical protein
VPFAYSIRRAQWYTTPYGDNFQYVEDVDDSVKRDPWKTPMFDKWTQCMPCHNTYPYETRVRSPVDFLSGYPREHMSGPMTENRERRAVAEQELVTVGISCESCHHGGREHTEEEHEISFLPVHEHLNVRAAALKEWSAEVRKNPYVVNALCAQCHGRNRPNKKYPDGGIFANSSEAYDMIQSCGGQIKCTDCHNPHVAGPPGGGGGPDDPKHVAACTKCHASYEAPQSATAHSRHPASAGVSCLDCHMPRNVSGFETITRSHLVSSPTNPQTFETAAPNACNLCHLDKSFAWTVERLQLDFGVDIDVPKILAAPAFDVWTKHTVPIVPLIALNGLARTKAAPRKLEWFLPHLNHPSARHRWLAQDALERALGRLLTVDEIDIRTDTQQRTQQLRNLARNLGLPVPQALQH